MANFISYRKEIEEALERAIDVGMEAVAQTGQANASREITRLVYDTPPSPTYVRTGNLRNSLTGKYAKDEKTVYIGTNVEYAPYVEFGTRRMKEKPYLRNACSKYVDEYKSILEDAINSL